MQVAVWHEEFPLTLASANPTLLWLVIRTPAVSALCSCKVKKIRDQNWRPTQKTTTDKQKGHRQHGPAPCLGSHSYVVLWWRPKGQGNLFSSSSVAVLDQVQLHGTLKSFLRLEIANKLIQKRFHSGKVKFHISYML